MSNLPPIESSADMRRHELFADMAEQTAKHLMEVHGFAFDTAASVGNSLADFLAKHWAGQDIYITSDIRYRHSMRDLEIFRRMGRGKAQQIAAEFGISYVRVYQIYARMLGLLREQQQPGLFSSVDDQVQPVTAAEAIADQDKNSQPG